MQLERLDGESEEVGDDRSGRGWEGEENQSKRQEVWRQWVRQQGGQ